MEKRLNNNIFDIDSEYSSVKKTENLDDDFFFIKGKKYNYKNITELFDDYEQIEKKSLDIKQYITDNIITEKEAYISLVEIESDEKRFLEIRKMVINKVEEELIDLEYLLGTDKATLKTLIRVIGEYIIKDYFDYGLLYEILQRDEVTNIKIYNGNILYTEQGSKDTKIYNLDKELTDKEVGKLVTKITRNSEMLTTSKPIVDTVLPKLNYRVNVILKSTTSSSTDVVAIRKKYDHINFKHYLDTGFFPEGWDKFFFEIMKNKRNVIIAGGTGSGKTTLLNAIAKDVISHKESLITIEDTPEIFVGKPAFIGFYSKKDVTGVAELFKASLRQQPDRIFVGEIRDGQMAYYMIQAMNTGHDGNLSTIHASSGAETIMRLINLLKQSKEAGEYDEKTIANMIRKSINYIIFVGKVTENNKSVFKMMEVLRVSEDDPMLIYKDKLKEINKILNTKGLDTNEYIRVQGELDYIKLQLEYAPVEFEYLLKYNREISGYEINKIDEIEDQIEKGILF